MTAAILAGGLGTRLRPAVADRPKVLAEVHGRPYLTFLLDQLAAAGIRRTILLTGYRADQIYRAVGEQYGDMRLIHSPEPRPLGTGGAVRHALAKLASPVVLLMNGDSWCDVDLAAFWNRHRASGVGLGMVLVEAADTSRYGRVQVGADGMVQGFEEKQGGARGWINGGIYLIDRSWIADNPPDRPMSLERELIPHWLGQGRKVFAYRHTGRFLDIGTPASYRAAETFLPGPKTPDCLQMVSPPGGSAGPGFPR
jgi:NDP-sugar pyrophosphorylase family protein